MSGKKDLTESNYLVKVDKKHIKAGHRYNSFGCPVALAIRDAVPSLEKVRVVPFNTINLDFKGFKKSASISVPYWLSNII